MKKWILTITTIFLLFFTACTESGTETGTGNSDNGTGYQKITAEQALDMMLEEKSYILLDVRTPEEFKEGRIDGAILIPDYEIEARAEAELPDKDALILIYCRSGRRSAVVARKMVKMGYTNIYDMGGIINWPYGTISD